MDAVLFAVLMRYFVIVILLLVAGSANAQLRWARSGPGGGGVVTGCPSPGVGGVIDMSSGCAMPIRLGRP